jgi:threonine synthase
MKSGKFIYKCTDCDREYTASEVRYLCPSCSRSNNTDAPPKGVLKTLYDYDLIRQGLSGFSDLRKNCFCKLMPVDDMRSLPPLRIGNTPLYTVNEINGLELPFTIHMKDDSQNPTWSFKDRASAIVSAFAAENNSGTIVTASTGNAGSSMAAICASQRQKAVIIVPEAVRLTRLTQIIMCGATIVPITGTYDNAFDLSVKATEEFGWYNRNTAFNPLTIEGKKTASFELFEQLNFQVPDRIFVPAGDGVIASGIYKGYEDLLVLNLIERMPVIVIVQSDKSDNLVRNLDPDKFLIRSSSTIADSISVDRPRNFHMTRQYIRNYNGEAITVSDEDILKAARMLAVNTGLFAEPAAAAAFAGLLAYKESERLPHGSSNVVMLTGSGLKDLRSVTSALKIPAAVEPTIENLKKLIH